MSLKMKKFTKITKTTETTLCQIAFRDEQKGASHRTLRNGFQLLNPKSLNSLHFKREHSKFYYFHKMISIFSSFSISQTARIHEIQFWFFEKKKKISRTNRENLMDLDKFTISGV